MVVILHTSYLFWKHGLTVELWKLDMQHPCDLCDSSFMSLRCSTYTVGQINVTVLSWQEANTASNSRCLTCTECSSSRWITTGWDIHTYTHPLRWDDQWVNRVNLVSLNSSCNPWKCFEGMERTAAFIPSTKMYFSIWFWNGEMCWNLD